MMGPLILEEEYGVGLVWSDNCSRSNGEMALANAVKCKYLYYNQWVFSIYRRVTSDLGFLSFYFSPENIYLFIYHDQIFLYVHMHTYDNCLKMIANSNI